MTEIHLSGNLRKMVAKFGDPVHYFFRVDEHTIDMADWLGRTIDFTFTGKIHCLHCGRLSKKSYSQGYCFPCCQRLAACDTCIVRPELCHYAAGTCRQPDWGKAQCFVPHIVYLANSSGIKVGITRASQLPTRWIDQGAVQAIPLVAVKSRYQSGLVEEFCKKFVNDKTNWRKMLKEQVETVDLLVAKQLLQTELQQADWTEKAINYADLDFLHDSESRFNYPVWQYPEKVSSINLEKTPHWTAKLQGIKGQYLITDIGVINIRKYTSYQVEICVS